MNRFANMLLIAAALIPASAASQVCVNQLVVPKCPPIARPAQLTGVVDLTVKIGAQGQVISVEGRGSSPILVQQAKENVKDWVFCEPKKNGNAHVHLGYDYRLEGVPVYVWPPAKVVIDLGSATVLITSPPGEPQP
jgi:outer membrane biosynthesis protein TonB